MNENEIRLLQAEALSFMERAGIVVTPEETDRIEIADFGLDDVRRSGLLILTYVNTDRCCAKELVLLPAQTCPEHRHPSVGNDPGKEETFRCRWGNVFLYVPGKPTPSPSCAPPPGREATYTSRREVVLNPGDQWTLPPDTLHWFQAGAEGAVVSEFSTRSTDENDIFTDPEIMR